MCKKIVSGLTTYQRVIVGGAKHWPLLMALVSVLWITTLINDYYHEVDTLEELKEDKLWLGNQGFNSTFMDEYIDDQEEQVEHARIQNTAFVIIHAIAVPIFLFYWNKKFRHLKVTFGEDGTFNIR